MKKSKNKKRNGKIKPKWGFLLVSLSAILVFALIVLFGYYLGSLVGA